MQKRLLFFTSLFFLLAAFPALGIGLSPATINIPYAPGAAEEFSFFVLNTRGDEIQANIYASGEYASFITFFEMIVRIEGGQMREIFATARFPDTPLTPGPQHVKIGVIEESLDTSQVQGVIPKVGVETKVKFDVPYPGKYIQFRLEVSPVNTGERLPVALFIKSYGREVIEHLRGTITLGTQERAYETIPVSLASILPHEERTFSTSVATDIFPPGDYFASGTFTYDGLQGFAETDFRIGTLYVNLTNYTRIFERGTVAPLDLHIASRWNKNIDDVYATIDIMQDGRGVAQLRTPSVSLGLWETAMLKTYWDTGGRSKGDYQARITLNYAQTSSTFDGTFIVYEKIKIDTTYILIGIIAFIVIVDALWFLRKRKSRSS